MIPIFLDTDIGDDIDDALALVVALRSPEVELRGVTTVFRDAGRRAQMALRVLELAGRPEVPVWAGESLPLGQAWEQIPEGARLGKQFEKLPEGTLGVQPGHAVPALKAAIQDAHAAGEKLTVVPIGPLTNIAKLFQEHPEVIERCRVVLMGGQWQCKQAEWNIRCDPEAAAVVFESGADLMMVGLDVTVPCKLSPEQVQQIRDHGTSLTDLLAEFTSAWGRVVTLHDPLTILTLFNDCVQFEPMHLRVELEGEKRAFTLPDSGTPNCLAGKTVDATRAVELFMERLLA